ncbi:MAG: acylphosphatase [Draconibacterium sp.]
MEQYEIKVTGRVQGVGFRYYAKKQADLLGLKGWVRNLSDGSVLALVQGDEVNISTFTDFLQIGPSLSHVTNIQKVKIQGGTVCFDFSIRH